MIYPKNFIYLLKLERGTIFKVGLHLTKQMNVVLTTLSNLTVVIFLNLLFLTLNAKNKCYKLILAMNSRLYIYSPSFFLSQASILYLPAQNSRVTDYEFARLLFLY